MKRRKGTVGERITSLEIAYGSQKRLAESLGVSTRTLRRWKHREDQAGDKLRAWNERTVSKRERYQYLEKYDTVPVARSSRELVLNVNLGRSEAFADVATVLPDRHPQLVRKLLDERPDIVVTVVHRPAARGGGIMLAPSSDPAEIERLEGLGYTFEQRYISGDDYSDWESLSSELWHVFRDTYKSDEG